MLNQVLIIFCIALYNFIHHTIYRCLYIFHINDIEHDFTTLLSDSSKTFCDFFGFIPLSLCCFCLWNFSCLAKKKLFRLCIWMFCQHDMGIKCDNDIGNSHYIIYWMKDFNLCLSWIIEYKWQWKEIDDSLKPKWGTKICFHQIVFK